jgi:hypothetical protein
MSTQWVTVYDPSLPGVSEAIVLNPEHLHTLATWLCNNPGHPVNGGSAREMHVNGGYCDTCRDTAGFLLVQCPFIDMERSPVDE